MNEQPDGKVKWPMRLMKWNECVWGSEFQLCIFLTLAQDGGGWSASHPSCFVHGERASVPILWEADGTPGSVQMLHRWEISLVPHRNWHPIFDCPAYSLVTVLPQLPCFWTGSWWDAYTKGWTDWQMGRCMKHTSWQCLYHIIHNRSAN
jgi:hypothetical protein